MVEIIVNRKIKCIAYYICSIALEAFDYHSGLNKVSWKIFINSTKDASINHGQSQKDLIGEVLVRKTKVFLYKLSNLKCYQSF
jgi:hypothetical protein